jgi:hypothetical protein
MTTRCYVTGCHQVAHHLDQHRWVCDDCHNELTGQPISDRIMAWWALMAIGLGTALIAGPRLIVESLEPMTPGRFWQLFGLTIAGLGLLMVGAHLHARETR